MAKVFNYIILIAGIILIFNFFGIQTPSSKILEMFDPTNPELFTLSNWFSLSLAALAAISIGGIAIGLYLRSSPESFILLAYATTLFVLISDLIAIISHLKAVYPSWIYQLVFLVFSPLIIGYVHAVISWWGNKQ